MSVELYLSYDFLMQFYIEQLLRLGLNIFPSSLFNLTSPI